MNDSSKACDHSTPIFAYKNIRSGQDKRFSEFLEKCRERELTQFNYNFLHGLPHWAVSIALEHKGQIVAGVIYDPVKDEMFYAENGFGAFVNEARLLLTRRPQTVKVGPVPPLL